MKELVLFLVKNIVTKPDAISVEETEREGAPTLIVRVAEEDKGRVIGRQGRVIKALRTLVAAAAAQSGQKTALDVE